MQDEPLMAGEEERKTHFRNVIFISFSQFGTAVGFNFVYVFLPFYVSAISPYSTRDTLLWLGAIMGSTGLCLAFTAPGWGSLSHKFSPKWLYLAGVLPQGVLMLLMGFFPNLHVLLILRILQGGFGGVSTAGLIIVSISSSPKNRAFHFGVFQSSLTLGQLLGPPAGSFAVGLFGYQWAFVSASLMLFAASLFCYFFVTSLKPLPAEMKSSMRSSLDSRTMTGWALCLVATIHLVYLPTVFPLIFQKFGLDKTTGLKMAGLVVMLYTCTSMIGTYLWSFLSRRTGARKMINFLLVCGVALPLVLIVVQEIRSFTLVVMLELGMVAAIIPLTISVFAAEPKGNVIGFINAARFVGMAVGPFLATSLLAFANTSTLYLSVSGITLAIYLASRAFLK
ncbi:MAG TPA: MFS transporter [Syntrophorhabdales bacterium]|nr:MFS transporter [Syntrophorhabdales bacterium]